MSGRLVFLVVVEDDAGQTCVDSAHATWESAQQRVTWAEENLAISDAQLLINRHVLGATPSHMSLPAGGCLKTKVEDEAASEIERLRQLEMKARIEAGEATSSDLMWLHLRKIEQQIFGA